MNSTVKPALVLMSGRSIGMLAAFLLPVALVRIFDPAGFGAYKQLFLVYTPLYQVGVVLAESLFYFVPRSPGQGGRYVANAFLALATVGLVVLAALWATAPALAQALGNPALAPHIPLVGLFLALMLPSATLEIVMISRRRYRAASSSYGLSDLLRVTALLAPALVWRRLDALLLGCLVFASARLCAALVFFFREFRGSLRPENSLFRSQLAYSLPFALAVIVETLQVNYHQYAVSHRFDAATFAVYSVGCFQIPLFEIVSSPMANVMMVRMAEKVREGRTDDAASIWAGTARTLALLFFPVVALLLVVARDVITVLFTDAYRASVPIFMIWSLSIALSALPTDGVLRVYAATRFLLVVSVLRLALIAALIGGSIAAAGLRGAVLVTIGVALVAKVLALVRTGKLLGSGLRGVLPWRALAGIALVAAAAAVPALVSRSVLEAPALVRLAVVGLVYAGVYLVLLFHSGLLADGEKRAFTGWFERWPLAAAGESRS